MKGSRHKRNDWIRTGGGAKNDAETVTTDASTLRSGEMVGTFGSGSYPQLGWNTAVGI